MLSDAGFNVLGVKDSHHVFGKGTCRVVVPFHAGQILHPKIVRQVLNAIAGN